MAYLVFLLEDGITNIFSTQATYVPRIGDTVIYRLASFCNKDEWDPIMWEEKNSLSGRYWEVVMVHQEFRKYRVLEDPKEIIYVYVKQCSHPISIRAANCASQRFDA
jgi:hypothetical protein